MEGKTYADYLRADNGLLHHSHLAPQGAKPPYSGSIVDQIRETPPRRNHYKIQKFIKQSEARAAKVNKDIRPEIVRNIQADLGIA
jgi:hypothetical protein